MKYSNNFDIWKIEIWRYYSGFPKVEQLVKVHPINSVSIDLEKGFEDWNKDMKKNFKNF
jgi:hypothetical protein